MYRFIVSYVGICTHDVELLVKLIWFSAPCCIFEKFKVIRDAMPLSTSCAWKVLNFDIRVSYRVCSSLSCVSTAPVSDRRADLSFSRAGIWSWRLLSSLSADVTFCRKSLTYSKSEISVKFVFTCHYFTTTWL